MITVQGHLRENTNSGEMEAKIQAKYLNDSQVAVFSVGTQVKDVPLYIHCGWKTKNKQLLSYKLKSGWNKTEDTKSAEACG